MKCMSLLFPVWFWEQMCPLVCKSARGQLLRCAIATGPPVSLSEGPWAGFDVCLSVFWNSYCFLKKRPHFHFAVDSANVGRPDAKLPLQFSEALSWWEALSSRVWRSESPLKLTTGTLCFLHSTQQAVAGPQKHWLCSLFLASDL